MGQTDTCAPPGPTPSAFPLPSPSPCPQRCSSQGLCNAGGFAALLLETHWKHLHRLVPREERGLHGCSPSLGWPRCGAPCCQEEQEEESRLQEESEPNILRVKGCDLIQENVSIWDFQRAGGTVHALGYGSPSTWSVAFWHIHLDFIERRALGAAPGHCRLEPFVASRNRQHPALRRIRPQSLTSGAFKRKRKKKSCFVLMTPFFRGS